VAKEKGELHGRPLAAGFASHFPAAFFVCHMNRPGEAAEADIKQ